MQVTQAANQASMVQIQSIVESSTLGLEAMPATMMIRDSPSKLPPGAIGRKNLEMISSRVVSTLQQMNSNSNTDASELSPEEILSLFMNLFSGNSTLPRPPIDDELRRMDDEVPPSTASTEFESLQIHIPGGGTNTVYQSPEKTSSPKHAASNLVDVLEKLREVDLILEQLGMFWANTEIVLDVLTRKGQHAEQFIAFAHKPRLLARFQERMQEYRKFWENVRTMCHNYISGMKDEASSGQDQREFEEVSGNGTPNVVKFPVSAMSGDAVYSTNGGGYAQKTDSSDSIF
jgi:hypothetical protein